MAKTIVALFDELFEARKVVEELENAGFSRDKIDLAQGEDAIRHIEKSRSQGVPVTEEKEHRKEGSFSRAWHRLGKLVGRGAGGHDVEHYEEGILRGGSLVVLADIDDAETDKAVEIMKRHHPVDIDSRVEEWRKAGWREAAAVRTERVEPAAVSPIEHTEEIRTSAKRVEPAVERETVRGETRIPVVEEELHVGKRAATHGGVRVHTHVEEKPVSEEVRLREEHVRVERRPTEARPVQAGEESFREQTFEFTEEGEEAVVGKRARVVEEVVIGKEVEERVEQVRDTVRRTEVDVEREGETHVGAERLREAHITDADNEDFRRHFDTRFATNKNFRFEEFEGAYRLGYSLGLDEANKDRDWDEVEPEARRIWESEHKGRWEDYKDAIHHGWSRASALVAS